MGATLVRSIFDDNLDNVVDTAPMAACLAAGTAECDSFLEGIYDIAIPVSPVPEVL